MNINFWEKLSAREVSKVLGVSRNTVAEVQALFLHSSRSWDDSFEWDDHRLYGLFYPDKFKYKPRYAPVDYSYVHKEFLTLLKREEANQNQSYKIVRCATGKRIIRVRI